MAFHPIDRDTWDRAEPFEHYFSQVPCFYSMTVDLDVTELKRRGGRFYPAVLYSLAVIVNRHREFRMAFNEEGVLGLSLIHIFAASAADGDTSEDTWFFMQDFAEWGDDHPSWVNVGWQYPEGFETNDITAIEVGIEDAEENLIMKYTADAEQVVYQRDNGYLNSARPVSYTHLMNRLVNIFPELKDELHEEKLVYGQVRFATFIKAHVVPRCEDLAQKYPNSDPMKKLCSLLDDMYANGDLDTRSLAAITLLNSLSDSAFQAVRERLGEELQKSTKYSRRLKGKKIKPEKKKKKKKVVAKPLDNKH